MPRHRVEKREGGKRLIQVEFYFISIFAGILNCRQIFIFNRVHFIGRNSDTKREKNLQSSQTCLPISARTAMKIKEKSKRTTREQLKPDVNSIAQIIELEVSVTAPVINPSCRNRYNYNSIPHQARTRASRGFTIVLASSSEQHVCLDPLL